MTAIGILAGSGWASGINLYLVTLLLGLAQRSGWSGVPGVFGRADLMVVAGVLFTVELVVDKIPYLDNAWDAIHTVVRPVGAAVIGSIIAGNATTGGGAAGAAVAAILAMTAHSAKATTRLAVNASPEPITNISLSVFEDVSVTGLMVLALTHPKLTLVVVAVLAVAAVAVTGWLYRLARRVVRTRRKRRATDGVGGTPRSASR